ncbi:MAG TPA: ABC transporter ATP-binding protein [Candidatus Saccharimonadales bacterium]|nr:ABC transporter ATP-binding protein [Candidatus Saccharimonadales bacterium]
MRLRSNRDQGISRAVHRLFRDATLADAPGLVICLATRIPALVLFNVLIPLQVAYGVQAIVTRHFSQVPHYVLLVLLCAAGYAVLWSIGGFTISRNGVRGSSYVQRTVFSNFLQKDYDFYSNTYFGALGSQAVQLRSVYSEYSQIFLLGGPSQAVTIVAGIGVVAWKSPILALVTLLCMAAVLGFTVTMSAWRLRLRRQLSEANSDLAGQIGDTLSHAPTVKSFASDDYEETRLDTTLAAWAKVQYRTWMSSIPADDGRMLLAAIATGVLLLMAARMYQHGTISIAIVALVQLYVIRMIAATQAIADLIKQYENVMGAAYSTMKTMLVEPTVLDPAAPKRLPKNSLKISFKDLTYTYDDATAHATAVAGFNLEITPGEKIGLVGYSGSGKTTLTKLLLRFMDATGGSIRIGGVDIRDVRQRELRQAIAYVPQEPLLFHRSINENIAYGRPSASAKEVKEAAKLAYVDEFVDNLPHQYQTEVGERGVKLSGGQRQRVAIARAILKDAPILVLDEATSALDSRSEKFIQQALWRLMKGRTALVVAHRLSTIQRMDRIVVMDKGRVVQIGTHNELLKDKKGIYATLWAHQSGGYMGVPDKRGAVNENAS